MADVNNSLKCKNCGATLQFDPTKQSLKCGYCGVENEIPVTPKGNAYSFDYQEFIAGNLGAQSTLEQTIVKCNNCGASVDLPAGITSDNCPFCASPLVISMAGKTSILKPHYVLPFVIDAAKAQASFKSWMAGLWFAPSDLVKKVNTGSSRQLQGIYLPHWCYDTDTYTEYTGSRGIYYYTTETYQVEEDGETRTETREVRHTQWWPVVGAVECGFENVLVSASPSLPQQIATTLEPWNMDLLVEFDERFLSGFRSETYRVDAKTAFEVAKNKMEPDIKNTIMQDIGGDEQIILTSKNQYLNTALKYIMLPVWLSSYRYNDKVYHFVVNANTGEVAGERPYSVAKIAGLVILIIAIIVAAIYFYQQGR